MTEVVQCFCLLIHLRALLNEQPSTSSGMPQTSSLCSGSSHLPANTTTQVGLTSLFHWNPKSVVGEDLFVTVQLCA